MARRGRPRINGNRKRYEGGRLKPKSQTEKQIKQTVITARLKYCNPGQANKVESGSLFGMLLLEGLITQPQYDAVQMLCETITKFRRVNGLGLEHLQIANLGEVKAIADATEHTPEYIDKVKKSYNFIVDAIKPDMFYREFMGLVREQIALAPHWVEYSTPHNLNNLRRVTCLLSIKYKIK